MSTCTAADVDAALEDLLDQHDALYHRQVDDLSTPQLNYLRALLNGVERMTTKETIDTYDLGSSANVKRVSTALEKKEVLDLVGRGPVWVDPMFRYLAGAPVLGASPSSMPPPRGRRTFGNTVRDGIRSSP